MRMPTDLFSPRALVYRLRALAHGRNPFGSGIHPDTNVDEGHLGGYVRGAQSMAPTSYGFENGDPLTWTPTLWRWTTTELEVGSVLDIGCGEGHSTRFFHELGCRVLGVDGSVQAKRDSVITEHHVVHDFSTGPFPLDQEFDLVWCCEFVEHVEERFRENFFDAFAHSSGYLIMTYGEPGQPGHHHVNCRPARFWIDEVESLGFRFDRQLTTRARSIAEPGHFQLRGLVFVRA